MKLENRCQKAPALCFALFGFGVLRGFSIGTQMTHCQKLLQEYAKTAAHAGGRAAVLSSLNRVVPAWGSSGIAIRGRKMGAEKKQLFWREQKPSQQIEHGFFNLTDGDSFIREIWAIRAQPKGQS